MDNVQKTIEKYQIKHLLFSPNECNIADRKLKCGDVELDMKGNVPKSGKIIIDIGKIISKEGIEREIGTENFPLRARLAKFSEVYGTDENHCTFDVGSCPLWLIKKFNIS